MTFLFDYYFVSINNYFILDFVKPQAGFDRQRYSSNLLSCLSVSKQRKIFLYKNKTTFAPDLSSNINIYLLARLTIITIDITYVFNTVLNN